ncbi:MAG: S1C family serine protease [Syntrophales bacterium]|jgi:hypothetical protein|nr:S1C family serine protease [Syntrophales bacterium]
MKGIQLNTIQKYFLVFVALLTTASLSHAEMKTSQIVEKYSQSVVTIIALDVNNQPLSLGSGFFVNENGDIATNHHVLADCAKAIIKNNKGETGTILHILNYDPQLDLIIAKTSLKFTKPLPFGDSDTVTIGEDILAIGNPAGLEGTVSKGIISGVREVDDIKFIQITAPISPGSSGGPVFDSAGKVIGIATAYLTFGQNLNFAMPINYLKSLKPNKLNLVSLPKTSKEKTFQKDDTLVQVFDVLPDLHNGDLTRVDFAIRNLHSYPIKNVELFIVYKNHKGEIISYTSMRIKEPILPKLALQFFNNHYVRNFVQWDQSPRRLEQGEVEIRILNYKIDRTAEPSPKNVPFKKKTGLDLLSK